MQNNYKKLHDAVTLSGTAAAGSYLLDVSGYDKATIYATYTPAGDTRNATLNVEFSLDGGTVWIPETVGVVGTGSGQAIATALYANSYTIAGATHGTAYKVRIPVAIHEAGILNSTGKGVLMRILVKEDGANTFGTMTVAVSLYGNITRG